MDKQAKNRDDLIQYYTRRAPHYEEIYHLADPACQQELEEIKATLREEFAERMVLEIACGTGWWTQILDQVACQIVGIDASREMLQLALRKKLPARRVHWFQTNAYALNFRSASFNGALASFWISHVAMDVLPDFLTEFHRCLRKNSRVVMVDNNYIPGRGGQLLQPSGERDGYKVRQLADGSRHRIVKNYFGTGQLQQIFSPWSSKLQVHMGEYYWWIKYQPN